MPHYKILSTAPRLTPTGATERTKHGDEIAWHSVEYWLERGLVEAKDEFQALAIAKHRWGGAPVVEPVTTH